MAAEMNIYIQYLSYGLSVIPCKDKRPVVEWKQYQVSPAPVAVAEAWKADQIACICGRVSGGLVCIDFDVKNGNKWDEYLALINAAYPALLSKLVFESTPSGGYHIIFRSEKEIRNIKLARNKDNMATIETRGEGGYFVCAPSPNYSFYYGDFSKLQKLSNEDTDLILSMAASLNEYTIEEPQRAEAVTRDGLTPFDDYNARHDIVGLLVSHGWKVLFNRGAGVYLQRPNKAERGISATWNIIPGRFYVFSTSTAFQNEHIYKASAVYTILEHNGDFNKAARELFAAGYGKKTYTPQTYEAILLNTDEMKRKIFDIKKYGYKKGRTTGWPELDRYYSVIKGQFTVITGMPSHGKSEFMDALAVNLANNDNWKFAIFSPENYPPEMHYHKLIEKISGNNLYNCIDADICEAIEFINEHFFFIDALEEDISLENILMQAEFLIHKKHLDGLIIDPFNEIELSRPNNISESDFIGACLRKSRKFARKHNIHLWIIAHPTKMQKIKDKEEYPVPELYDISGSAHWRNKADNGICVHRNMLEDTTYIYIQKIKFRFTGKQGTVVLKYNKENGRYEEYNSIVA
jgi:hypothetical protein